MELEPLTIRNISDEAVGMYRCVAQDSHNGVTVAEIKVEIATKSKIVDTPVLLIVLFI